MNNSPLCRGLSPLAPAFLKPPLRGLAFPPAPRFPHSPAYLPPLGRASPHAAATLPPFARPSTLARAALPRRYADPRSASRRSGIAAPASATAPPLTRLGAACAGGGCPRRWRGCGWNSLAVRSLASASGVALGVKIGGVLRGVLPRSSALRASGGGARVFSAGLICP